MLRPEFLNRIDETLLFLPLKKNEILQIVAIQLNILKSTLAQKGISLVVKDDAAQWISETGYDPFFGARPVKRIIQKEVLNELSKALLSGKIDKTQSVVMDIFDGKIVFRKPILAEEEI
jgi:ATP-dependent Clp protease ATP-binding subunit ClpB